MKKTAMVLEGGATRGVFTSGVLDYLMEKDFYTSYVVGVSAGAVSKWERDISIDWCYC